MVVLNELCIYAQLGINPLAIGFGKEPTMIAKAIGFNDQHSRQVSLLDFHHSILYCCCDGWKSELKGAATRKAKNPALIWDVALLEMPGQLRPDRENQQQS